MTISQLTSEELQSFIVGLKSKYGVDFSHYNPNLLIENMSRWSHFVSAGSMFGLWASILRDSKLGEACIEKILNRETAFFRNPHIWKSIKDYILPAFTQKENISIWSAGCATGEEAYSIAIMLEDTGLLSKSKIWATDIRQSCLNAAKSAAYPKNDWARFLQNYLVCNPKGKPTSHFIMTKDNVVQPNLRKNIVFERQDLTAYTPNQKFDIIFCRRVLNYFNEEMQDKLLENLAQSLHKGGFLILSSEDKMPPKFAKRLNLYIAESNIYMLA